MAGGSPEEILAAYRSRPDVEYAEFNPIISICATPSDPSYGEQWSLEKIHAPEAWDTCRGGNEVVVAIIDTGVDYNHRDLQGNLWVNEAESKGVPGEDDDGNGYVDDIHGYNFAYNNSDPADDHGHGTHVTGIVAAAGNNELGRCRRLLERPHHGASKSSGPTATARRPMRCRRSTTPWQTGPTSSPAVGAAGTAPMH